MEARLFLLVRRVPPSAEDERKGRFPPIAATLLRGKLVVQTLPLLWNGADSTVPLRITQDFR